jgi:hypothetical protein
MKTFMRKISKIVYEEKEFKITKVIHELPTWMFPYASYIHDGDKFLCPICHKEMELQIAHGSYIETCSMIQVNDFRTHPIHRECYDKLTDTDDQCE